MHLANQAVGHLNIERRLATVGAENLILSAIALAELRTKILRGAGRVQKDRLERLAVIVSSMKVEPFTQAAAERAALIMAHLETIGKRNEWPDVLIAGQAAAAGYRLVTDDAALLATPGIDTVNWRL